MHLSDEHAISPAFHPSLCCSHVGLLGRAVHRVGSWPGGGAWFSVTTTVSLVPRPMPDTQEELSEYLPNE